ncbi:hypothetical protein DXG01_008429 [Tephrocybe rancida]|nr:hypothetical protein DXG01_008429 [Tephrocybe rancida]
MSPPGVYLELDTPLEKKRRISHPYPLTTSVAPTSSGADQLSPLASQPTQDPTSTLRHLSPVLLSVNLSPLSVPYPPAHNSNFDSTRSPLIKPAISPELKQRERRKPSLRIRRSPTIGPSPLRAMILPDASDSKIKTSASQLGSRNSHTTLDYSNIGLGLPKSPFTATSEISKVKPFSYAENSQPENTSKTLSATLDTEDPNTLVGMIRELVEETDQWDGSLFKDKNFKAMIDGSKRAFKGGRDQDRISEDSSQHAYGDGTVWEDKSCEVDLSLLGLDIFRSGGETFIPGADNKELLLDDDATKPRMVSFWEDNLTNWPVKPDHGTKE